MPLSFRISAPISALKQFRLFQALFTSSSGVQSDSIPTMEYFIASGLVILAVGIKIFLSWLRKYDDYWEKRGVPYTPRQSHFTVLKTLASKPIHELMLEANKMYGRVYGGFEFRKPAISVSEPDLLRDILVKDFHIFSHRRDDPFFDGWISKMVSVLNGEDWKRIRTIITPAFTSKRMRQMSSIINESSETVVENFGKYADRKEPVDCKEFFGAFTMDVIASAAFGTKIDSHNDPDNLFVRNVKRSFLSNSVIQMMMLLLAPSWLLKLVPTDAITSLDFFKDVVLQVISQRKQSGKRYNDILQLLMDAQEEMEKGVDEPDDEEDQFGSVTNSGLMKTKQKYNKLTAEELVAQCVLFFVVGYETTASTLTFLAYSLALNPDCQETLIREVDDAFQKNKEFNHDVIRDMKYLDCVVSETLRMYPSLIRGERTAVEDYNLGETGIVVEKGMIVGFNIHAMHYDPEFFVNPEKFDPDRFKPENMSHPQYGYLPFGAGPRNCLGMRFALMEIKLCICNILRHYRFKVGPATKVPLEYTTGILLGAKVSLMIERR